MAKNTLKVFSIIIFFLWLGFTPSRADAANLSVSPITGNFEVGERLSVRVVVTSANTPFNAISGVVSFTPSIFTIESISKVNSVLNFWVTEPSVSTSLGTVKFEGVALGGFVGNTGTVITVNLRALKVGIGTVAFESGQVLANDGQGTDITSGLTGANYYVKEAVAKPTPPPAPTPKPTPKPTPTPEPVQPEPTLNAPEIMLGDQYGADAIVGTSDYPKAEALITFTSNDGVKVFILGTADAEGSFNLLVPHTLKHGVYKVGAVMIREDKTNSQPSNEIFVKVGSIWDDLGWQISLVIVLLILALIYLILRVYLHVEQYKNNGKTIDRRKLHQAREVIHQSFDILREDIIDYNNEKISDAEVKHLNRIKKDVNDAEKAITDDIKSVETK